MAEETQADQTGIERTADGTIADQSQATQPTTTETPATTTSEPEGKTLLTEGKKPEEKVEAAKGAPEKYEDYKVPEGFELNTGVKDKVDPIFRELGLSQEGAQKMVDLYTDLTKAAAEAPGKAWTDMANAWRIAAENHPDLKGKIGPGKEVSVRIAKAIDGLNDPQLASDFRKVMEITMAGNNPAFIRVLDKFAQRLTEGTHVAGNGPTRASQSEPGKAPPSAAGAMWPNLPSSRPN